MNDLKQAMLGVMAVLLLGMIVCGSLALAMVEDRALLAELPHQVMDIGQPAPENAIIFRPETGGADELPSLSGSVGELTTASEFAEVRAMYACSPPAGWTLYVIRPDDSLNSLSLRFKITPAEFAARNCLDLLVTALPSGSTVFVPAIEPPGVVAVAGDPVTPAQEPAAPPEKRKAAAARQKAAQCGPPSWWVVYRVQRGDTLSRLGALTGASVAELQQANCLGASTIIRVGQALYVPAWPVAAAVSTRPRQPTAAQLLPTEQPGRTPTAPNGSPRPTATSPRSTPTIYPTLPPTQPPTAQPTERPTEPPLPTEVPPTQAPPPTEIPPTEPPAPPTEPPAPPTEPPVPPTEPPAPPTEPPAPPTQPPAPPTEPPAPPTEPPAPPTEPPAPPTEPPAPPTEPPAPPTELPVQPTEAPTAPDDGPQAYGFMHILALPWYDPIVRLAAILFYNLIG